MASNILIKRSTGSTAPGSITFGELAITTGANGTQANAGDRLFVGAVSYTHLTLPTICSV